MATQTSLLPVYHEDPSIKSSSDLNMDVDLSSWMTQQPNPQDEAFLQELLSGQGVRIVSNNSNLGTCLLGGFGGVHLEKIIRTTTKFNVVHCVMS